MRIAEGVQTAAD